MSQFYSVIIYWGISALGHVKEVIYGINAIDKRYINKLMSNFQLNGSKWFDYQIHMQNITENMM